MAIPVREFSNVEYPEDPALRSIHYGKYSGRSLILVQKDETHFDFIFKPTDPHTATFTFPNVDVSLMTPSEPEWTKADPGLERIALSDRQWNRQQVSFDLVSRLAEHAVGLGQIAEQLVIIPIIIVGGLEGVECVVKRIACDQFEAVQQPLVARVQPHHRLLEQDFDLVP